MATLRGFQLSKDQSVVVARRMDSPDSPKRQRQRRALHFCLDNSASMGANSDLAKRRFAQLLELATEPSSFTVFNESASTLSTKLCWPAEMAAVQLPSQGRTNISAGLEHTVNAVIEAVGRDVGAKEPIHHVIVLLTDGAHNDGPSPEYAIPMIASELRRKAPAAMISVVVVGVSSASKTSLGMLAKTALESAAMQGLDPMYFCKTAGEMDQILSSLQKAMQVFDNTELTTLALMGAAMPTSGVVGAGFVQDVGVKGSAEATVFLEDRCHVALLLQDPLPCELEVNGVPVHVERIPVNAAFAINAVSSAMEKLRQRRVAAATSAVNCGVASSVLHEQAARLGHWIDAVDSALAQIAAEAAAARAKAEADGDAPAANSAAGRLRRLKKKAGTVSTAAKELRNELEGIMAFRSDDSASQAAFLNGGSSKFATKALIRNARRADGNSDALDDPAARVTALAAELRRVAAALPTALRQDALLKLARLSAVELEALEARVDCELLDQARAVPAADVASCQAGTPLGNFLDGGLPDALDAVREPQCSWLSLLSNREQLLEWASVLATDPQPASLAEYEALCYLGSLGQPIEVERCAATQMSPYQMRIARIWHAPIDTASLLCAHKCQDMIEQIKAPEGGSPRDVLPLVDPELPRASRLVCRSGLMDLLCSVTLCRDLHMFGGNEQRMALHAHALLAALDEPPTEASVRLALRIVYSARQHLGRSLDDPESRYVSLLKRLVNWESLTEADGVDHPAQLLLALVVLDRAEPLSVPALYNLCNETLSRQARLRLKGCTDGSAAAMREEASARMRKLLTITEESCPKPTGTEEPEPARSAVKEACAAIRPGYAIAVAPEEVETDRFCIGGLHPTIRCVHFANALQRSVGDMASVMVEIERGSDSLVEPLLCALKTVPRLPDALELGQAHEARVLATMEAQAFLHHTSATRQDLPDVRDAETMSMIAVELRMQVYDVALALKMREWNLIAGDVIAQRAMQCGDDEFAALVSTHAHRFTKKEFWALAAHARRAGGARHQVFLSACNHEYCAKWG